MWGEVFILWGHGKDFDVVIFFSKVGSAVSVFLVLFTMSSGIPFVEALE